MFYLQYIYLRFVLHLSYIIEVTLGYADFSYSLIYGIYFRVFKDATTAAWQWNFPGGIKKTEESILI